MKFTNTKKKNNNEGLLYKTGVSRPLEDMGAGASHSTYTESVQDRIGTHNQEMEDIRLRQQRRQRNRQEFQMAIELAKQNASSNSNVNAGDNRTTAYNKPQSISVYGGYGTLPNPATQGMNTAANGAKIDYSAVSQKAKKADTQNKGWKGLNFGKGTENISTEDSVKNATKALSGYDSNQLDLLEQYVKASDNDEASIFMAALTKDYSNLSTAEQSRKDQARIKEEFMKNSGVSEEEFNNLVQYASYMSHYNAEQSLKEQIQNSSGLTKAALSVADVATFPAQSMMDLGDRIVHDKPTAPGIGRDNHNFYTALHDISQNTEEAVLNEADTIENPFLREATKFGYQTTMAAGKSYTAAMTGDVGLLFFGSSAYTDAARDAEERGLDDTQVQLYAITAGLTEMATEKIPQDHLRSMIFGGEASEAASKGFKESLKQIAIQMAEEGNEEAVNDVVNTITDALIAGDKSQANIDYQNYIANGMTEDQALKQVIWDKAKEIGYDYAVGAVSGGMSAGAAVGFNAGMETHAGRTIAKDSEVNNAVLEDISSDMDAYESQEAYDQAQQTRKDVISASQNRLSGRQARELYRNVVQATDNAAQTRSNMIKAANEDAQIRKEIANQPDTYKAPEKTQAQIVEDIEFASTPYELAKAIEAVKTETDEIKELIAFKRQELVDFGANEKDVDNAITPKKAFEMGQKGEPVTEEQLKAIPERDRQEVLENNNYQLNKTIIRENPTAIIDKESGKAFIPAEVKVDGSDVVVLDEAGNEHKELFNPRITRVESVLSQVSKDFNTGRYTDQSKYNTTVQQAAYAIDMAIKSPEAEPMLIGIATQSIFDNASVGSKTWSEYVKGTHGMFTKIDQTAAEKLYNEVREQAKKSDSVKQENTKGQRTHNETVSKTLRENLSDEAVALYEALGKKIGYDFVASTNKDARGDINPATRTISIGANNIDEMWAVANHEAIAEYLQAHGNEKDLIAVQDDMLNYLEEKLGSLEYNNLINAYQSAYRTGAAKGSVDEGKSRRAAANEMFNDTVFALMSSEEGTKDFINWVTENNTPAEQKTILQRAKDFFRKIFDYIQNYVHSGSFNAAEKAALEMDAKQARELRKRIFKLMDEAIANANSNATVESTKSNGKVAVIPTVRSSKRVLDNPTSQLDVNGNLIVVHNLTADKLLKVLTYNGIPMPSLAVTKAEIGHSNFGDITLIFNKDTIDPKKNKKNHTYSADVWSPVFPQIDYDINNDVIAAVDETVRKADIPDWMMRNATNKYNDMERKLKNASLDEILNEFKQDISMQAVYLSAIQKMPVEMKQTEEIVYMDEKTKNRAKFIQALGNIDDFYKMPFDELNEKLGLPLIKYLNKIRLEEDANAKLMPETKEYLENSKMAKAILRHSLEYAREYEKTGGKEINIVEDTEAEKNFIRENIDTEAYEKWIEDSFKDVVNKVGIWNNKEYLDSRGNRRTFDQLHYAVTAENIVKAMMGSSEDIRNASGFNHGIKGIRSVVADDFASIEDIKNASNRLSDIDSGIFDDMLEQLDKRHTVIMDEIIDQNNKSGNKFMMYDSVDSAIMEAAANPSVKNIIAKLNEYSWKITEKQAKEIADIIAEVRDMPVNMFEAKPQRVVGFDEILRAIIPSDTEQNIKDALDNVGIEYAEYERGNEDERKSLISETPGARFSKKIDADYDKAFKANDIEQMQQLVEQAAVDAGYEPTKLYHGTNSFGFTEFAKELLDDKNSIFVAEDINIASSYTDSEAKPKRISEGISDDIWNKSEEELLELYNNRAADKYRFASDEEITADLDEHRNIILNAVKKLKSAIMIFDFNESDLAVINKVINALESATKPNSNVDYFDIFQTLRNSSYDVESEKASETLNKYVDSEVHKALSHLEQRVGFENKYFVTKDGKEILWTNELIDKIEKMYKHGIYELYGKANNLLTVDAKGQNWNNINNWSRYFTDTLTLNNTHIEKLGRMAYLYSDNGNNLGNIEINEFNSQLSDKELQEFLLSKMRSLYEIKTESLIKTRDISQFAREHGFDGVRILSVKDSGGKTEGVHYPSNVRIYFNSSQLKSADPVTYDNDGNVIPLSERFNTEESDLRFSKKVLSMQQNFANEYDAWDKKNNVKRFTIGKTGPALQTLGVPEQTIELDAKKLLKIITKHPNMSDEVIKQIPNVVNDPILIMDSKNSDRLVCVGELQDVAGNTVIAILELHPKNRKGVELDVIKLASAYGKDGLQNLINQSNIRYITPNKKRISQWRLTTRLQLPVVSSMVNSNLSIPSENENATTTSSSETAENTRNSFKVYGEASPYADSINESKVVAAMIGSINNSLPKTDVFAMPNDELLRIERFITNKYKVNMSEIEEGEIAANISYAFAYMQNNKLDRDYENMMNYLLNIGDEVIKNSNMKDPETEEIYNNTRKILASHKFKLSDAERAEISNAFGGSWKAAFGAINKAGIKLDNKNGQPVDDLFSEIKQEILNTAGIDLTESDKPSEQILALIDIMTALEPTAYLWEGANDMDKALTVVTDIVEQYYSAATEQLEKNVISGTEKGKAKIKSSVDKEKARLRGEWAKYKDKKQKEFDEVVAEKNRIIQQQQNQLRQQDEQMKKWNSDLSAAEKKLQQSKILTEKQMRQTARLQAQQTLQSYKDRQERAKQIENIKKTGIRLIKWLTNPTDAQHVPEFLQKPLGEFLGAIDFLPKNAKANSKSTLTWQQRMNALREVLKQIEDAERNGENTPQAYFAQNVIAKELVSMMDEFLGKETWDEFTQSYIVSKRAASKVSKLDAKDLATLNKIMSALSAGINNMNKTYANDQFKEISKLSRESVKEIDALPARKDMQKLLSKAFDFANFDELEPITYFEGLGSGAKSVFDELRQGFNTKTRHVREADEYISNIKKNLGLSDADISKWKYESHDFDLLEGKLSMNTNQIMSLYETLKRKQGKPHVAIGGVKVSDFEYGPNLKKKMHHQPKAIHISSSEAQAIINTLTDEQRVFADAMQQYMATECASWGNRVTEKMFGYKKYEEKDYFPLKTDAHTRATTASSDNNVSYYSIKNSSFTKPITPMANNAVVIDDIFDVFTDHVVKMADYDAYVMPIADAMRWFNYSEKTISAVAPDTLNELGQRVDYIGNMQESIDRVYGNAGLSYFKQFIKDINGDYAGKGGKSEFLSAMMSTYKAQAVGANMRVVIQQPTAVVRAADVIETKYLLEAMTSIPKAAEYAKKAQANSEIAYWKAQGYYETYLGQSFKEIITGDTTLKDKINDWSGKLAGAADDLSWGIMYRAAELKVQQTMPQLKIDSAAYTEAVVKIFEDIVDHTQVVDTIFHKSQWMRSQELGHKITSAFMAEPTKTYNMLYRAYRDAKLSGSKPYAMKRLKNVALIFIFEQLLNAFITGGWDALRDDEKENFIKSFMEHFSKNAVDNLNPLNLMPIAKEISSALQGYDATSYTTDFIYTAVDTFNAMKKLALGKSTKTVYGNTYQLAKATSQMTGIPIANIMREFKTIYNMTNDFWGGKDLVTTQGAEKKQQKNASKQAFTKAYESNDLATAKSAMQDIYDKSIAAGNDESEAWGAVRDTLKEEYLSQIEKHPEDVATINNRFAQLVSNTKHKVSGTYKNYTVDQAKKNYIDKWYASIE